MLTDQEFIRYSRQLLLVEFSNEGQEKLKNSNVLIVGLGGLGSPVSLYLAAAGVGNLLLADYDNLNLSNLQRQILYDTNDISQSKAYLAAKKIKKINPLIKTSVLEKKLYLKSLLSIIKQVDLVIDCSDNIVTRHDINAACVATKTTLISGSAVGFLGQLIVFEPPFCFGCYACLYPDKKNIELSCHDIGVLGPIVGVIGSLQALEAIKILIGYHSSLNGKICLFDGIKQQWNILQLSVSFQCLVCQEKT
ncbi:Sulfur carrier protein ThiS adenylyltransferase [Candidatus Providencia siddallii]|uniref:Sulfur carrier protein ThiS adenylyltransferase n=1 Tax=Candidatus Providencia siddallii TaxID=1715285 RepID=A0A0M6W9C2_9GAMM|nr:Sulfur carrier protein ThiS adenylyltransferase [Candidatus Providencia siddallii]